MKITTSPAIRRDNDFGTLEEVMRSGEKALRRLNTLKVYINHTRRASVAIAATPTLPFPHFQMPTNAVLSDISPPLLECRRLWQLPVSSSSQRSRTSPQPSQRLPPGKSGPRTTNSVGNHLCDAHIYHDLIDSTVREAMNKSTDGTKSSGLPTECSLTIF